VAPALTVSIFNLKRDQPIAPRSLDLRAVTTRTYGGLVLEMGDVAQHGSFDAFARHIRSAELKAEWTTASGSSMSPIAAAANLMEAGFTTDFGQPTAEHFAIDPGAQERAIPIAG